VNEYTERPDGEEPDWSVQRDFEIRLDDDPLLLEPAAKIMALLGELRGDVGLTHLLYWGVRCYGAVRDALGVPPGKDGVRSAPFGRLAVSWGTSYDEVCTLVGRVFGPQAEAGQRRAFGLEAGPAAGGQGGA
jgi:hypothetical protein